MKNPDRNISRLLGKADPGTDSPDILRIQPLPVGFSVKELPFPGGQLATALTREWADGDTFRCRLCPTCTANHVRATCTVLVDQFIGDAEAELFTTIGLTPILSYQATR